MVTIEITNQEASELITLLSISINTLDHFSVLSSDIFDESDISNESSNENIDCANRYIGKVQRLLDKIMHAYNAVNKDSMIIELKPSNVVN